MAIEESGEAGRAWLHDVLAAIGRRWWLVVAAVLSALLIAIVQLRGADYVHSAELKVFAAPSSSGRSAPSGLGGLGGLAAAAGLSSAPVDQASPFRFYLDAIYSPEAAARLAKNDRIMHRLFASEWDPAAKAWREPPPGMFQTIRRAVLGLLGLPLFGWQAPDGARLQSFIRDAVTIRQSVRTPVITLGIEMGDPEFATYFLTQLHTTVDAMLREQQAQRTRGNIAYLSQKLTTVTLAEQRAALIAALTEQERQAMLAYGNAPYAADPLDIATASLAPVKPKPGVRLVGAATAGLIVGLVLAWWFGRRDQARPR